MSNQFFERYEAGKKSLESKDAVHSFERWSSPHTHPGGSVIRLILQKLRVLAMYVIRRAASGRGRVAALSKLSQLADSASECDVLVIASGPSADLLNAQAVAKSQSAGNLVVVATNYFIDSALAKTITPDYLVWSDSVFHPRNRNENPSWGMLENVPSTTVVVPWTWKQHVPGEFVSRVLYFDNETLETWSRNISPLRPRGYIGTTGAKALALGIHLGPKTTYVLGLDLSYFKNFTVDAENVVWRHPSHISGTDSGVQNLTHNTVSGIADSLYSTASQFYSLKALFSGFPVVNLDPHSLVDAFPKVTSHPLIKKTGARTSASKK